MLKRLKAIKERFKLELNVYRLIVSDPRTPRPAKWLLGAAIAYAISPIDVIPDFIPVLGHLDDILIVPTLIVLAVKLVPRDVVDDCRRRAKDSN
jgi:uncharacterized membrane protein YkvA (DUF1232 family)